MIDLTRSYMQRTTILRSVQTDQYTTILCLIAPKLNLGYTTHSSLSNQIKQVRQ